MEKQIRGNTNLSPEELARFGFEIANLHEEMAFYDALPKGLRDLYDALPMKYKVEEIYRAYASYLTRVFDPNAAESFLRRDIMRLAQGQFPSWTPLERKRFRRA